MTVESTVTSIPTSKEHKPTKTQMPEEGLRKSEEQVMNGRSNGDILETAKWTRFLPEAFGIRDSVRQSSYRWCVRES